MPSKNLPADSTRYNINTRLTEKILYTYIITQNK